MASQGHKGNERQILGINFFVGDARSAVERISRGGLLVVPSAPVLRDIGLSESHRDALIHADVAITDSALMVLMWNWMEGDSIERLSGLKYMRELLLAPDFRAAGQYPVDHAQFGECAQEHRVAGCSGDLGSGALHLRSSNLRPRRRRPGSHRAYAETSGQARSGHGGRRNPGASGVVYKAQS